MIHNLKLDFKAYKFLKKFNLTSHQNLSIFDYSMIWIINRNEKEQKFFFLTLLHVIYSFHFNIEEKFFTKGMTSGNHTWIEHFMEYFIKIPPCYTAQNNGRISGYTENAPFINTKEELPYENSTYNIRRSKK